jgi:Tol biopolymer transport system component
MGVFGNRNGFYGEMTYNQGYSMVIYMDSVFGETAVRQTAQAKSYFTFNRSLKKAVGMRCNRLYDQCKRHLIPKYSRVVGEIKPNFREGKTVIDEGYWDFHGAYSPQTSEVAFVSNRGYDVTYPHLFVKNMETGRVKQLTKGRQTVLSRLQWFPDGTKLLYSRYMENTALKDIYIYDLTEDKEKQITWHARALDPALSPDGKTIAYIHNKGGIQNLALIDVDGKNNRNLTNFNDGTQLYSPCWTPDGKKIILGIFKNGNRDIAVVKAGAAAFDRIKRLTDSTFFPDSMNYQSDLEFALLVHTRADERDPCISPDGEFLYYACDQTGIFNIYRMHLKSFKVEQITNILGGAFSPSVHPDGEKLIYTGFHAANYSIYEIDLTNMTPVKLDFVRKDYSKRFKDPFIFSATPNAAQYRQAKYEPKFTMWHIGPFLSFEPTFITDTVGFSQLNGGLNFASGELAGYSNLMGSIYVGKDFRSQAGLSWGAGFNYDKGFPQVFGENKKYYPKVTLFGARNMIRSEDPMEPDSILPPRFPGYAFYLPSDNYRDTLLGVYMDDEQGAFRVDQTFDVYGATANLNISRRNELGLYYARQKVGLSADVFNNSIFENTGIFRLYNNMYFDETKSNYAEEITGQVTDTIFDNFRKQFSWVSPKRTTIDLYNNFNRYQSHIVGLNYRYTDIRPYFYLPTRVDYFGISGDVINSRYSMGTLLTGIDRTDTLSLEDSLGYVLTSTTDDEGRIIPQVHSMDQEEDYFQLNLYWLERFPIIRNRSFITFETFFGSLNRKLPAAGDVFPLRYRTSFFLRAYPYAFDPIDTMTVRDSFPMYEYVAPFDSMLRNEEYVKFKYYADKEPGDIMWGNRLLYLKLECSVELFRGLAFEPLGLLFQTAYLTPFVEAASVWNTDWKDFTLDMVLGKTKSNGRLGESYLKDCGLRFELPFVLFENWGGIFYFIWAYRLDLDDKIVEITKDGRILGLDKHRFSFGFYLLNF